MKLMFDPVVIEKMKGIFPHVHPLAFHRSMERAESTVVLFDILEKFPEEYPVVWDETAHRWKVSDDLSLADRFNFRQRRDE